MTPLDTDKGEPMKTLPEILEQFHEYTSIKLTHSDKDNCVNKITPAIAKELMGIIGEDEVAPKSGEKSRIITIRKQLRAEQKKRLTAFIGKE